MRAKRFTGLKSAPKVSCQSVLISLFLEKKRWGLTSNLEFPNISVHARPPTNLLRSIITISVTPFLASSIAATHPAGPAPNRQHHKILNSFLIYRNCFF